VVRNRYNPRILFVIALGVAGLAATIAHSPVAQWKDYHDLADARGFAGIPNAWNVLSNLPFLVAGILGLRFLSKPSHAFAESWERGPYAMLMSAFILVFFGSSLYHWNPTDRTLFWDRVPLALVFSSILGIMVIERVSPRWGARLFVPFLAAGVASVVYWRLGNAEGRGDLRFYALMQGSAVLAVPLFMILFTPRYTGGGQLLAVVALYGVAKLFETYDKPIYALGHVLSGHTLKHLLAGLAAGLVLSMLKHRRVVEPGAPAETLVAPAPQA
jgi:hypothetical protein